MKPVILFPFGSQGVVRDEFEICGEHFETLTSRIITRPNRLVIGRYSVLPGYDALAHDLLLQGHRLINSLAEHRYVADFEYYEDLKEFTFLTWSEPHRVPKDSGPWVLKGRTNSRKFQWDQYMFCRTWEQMMLVYRELMNDPFIGPQGVVIRKYTPLEVLAESIAGPPLTNEWRFFFIDGQYLCHGYYWSSAPEEVIPSQIPSGGMEFAQTIANRVRDRIRFVCIDIALTESGKWVLVELNDGQMSGLSEINPAELYYGLATHFTTR